MMVAVAGAIALGRWSEAASVVCLFALAQWLEIAGHGPGARSDPGVDGARAADRAGPPRRGRTDPPGRGGADRRSRDRPPRRADSARRDRRERRRRRRSGAGDGGITADREGAGRRAVRRHHQRPRVARGRGDAVGARLDIARIIHLVERAQAQRAPTQAFVDRFARIYTPAVLALAIAVAVAAAAGRRRAVGDVDLPGAGAAGDRLPLRAGHLDAGLDRLRAGRRGAPRRADQGRRPARAARHRSAPWRSTRPAR